MQKLLIKHLSAYHHLHQNFINRILNYVAVPLILFSFLIIFNWIHIRVPNFFDTSLAWLLIVLVLIYYLFLDIIFASTLTVIFLLLNLLATYFAFSGPSWLSFQIFLITFIIGWVLIFIGHFIEHKRFVSIQDHGWQIIFAPIYMTAEAYFCLGYRKSLEQELDASCT